MNIYSKLAQIQQELKVPKNMFNSFGKYNYRNAETILETVKPLLAQYGCMLTLDDVVMQYGDRYYIRAIATLIDLEDESSIKVSASARESDSKKGMDAMQITGCASSYARKYCLNGLFLLDDSKDADTDEWHNQTTSPASITALKRTVKTKCKEANINADAWLAQAGVTWDTITAEQLASMLRTLKEREVQSA